MKYDLIDLDELVQKARRAPSKDYIKETINYTDRIKHSVNQIVDAVGIEEIFITLCVATKKLNIKGWKDFWTKLNNLNNGCFQELENEINKTI